MAEIGKHIHAIAGHLVEATVNIARIGFHLDLPEGAFLVNAVRDLLLVFGTVKNNGVKGLVWRTWGHRPDSGRTLRKGKRVHDLFPNVWTLNFLNGRTLDDIPVRFGGAGIAMDNRWI
jgi:hypothetical protein